MKAIRLLLLAVLAALAGCDDSADSGPAAGKPEPLEWRFALEEIQGSVQDAYAQKFAALIEEKTDGRVQVNVFPYGSLGTSAQLTELVQQGQIEFAFASPGHLGSVIPEVQVLTLHFLFSDDNAVNQAVLSDSPTLYGPLAEAYQEKDLKLLALIPEGWMVWTADRELSEPADFQGLKIRTMVSPLLIESYEAYGASPTPMPYSDVYSGLQLGSIDAQVNPVFAIEEMSFYEVQDYMVMPRHSQFIASLVTNDAFYASLSPELRQAVDEAKAELDAYIFRVQHDYNQQRLETIRANSDIKVVELDDAQRAAFEQLSLPVRDTYRELAGERGARILQALERELEAADENSANNS